MKKVIIICAIVIGLFVPAFLFASSCDSEAQGYFIKFTMEGQEYNLTYGYTDVGTGEPYAVLLPGAGDEGGDLIRFFGSDVESDSTVDREDLDNVVDVREVRLYPHTQGVYEDVYDMATSSINSHGALVLQIIENSELYRYESRAGSSGTLTISVFGEEGEAVEGTFDITLGLGPAALGDPSLTITGEFRLKRVSSEEIL